MTEKPGLMRWLKGLILRRVHGMITCREFEDFVLAYLDGELPAHQSRIFERHMRMCRECREYLAAYERALEVGRTALVPGANSVPEEVPEDLVKAVLEARDK